MLLKLPHVCKEAMRTIQSAKVVPRSPVLIDTDEHQTKLRLAGAVNDLLKTRQLKQREIAELLNIPQPKVSALKNFRLDQFSVEKLLAFLTALHCDVEIMIRPHMGGTGVGQISVVAVQ